MNEVRHAILADTSKVATVGMYTATCACGWKGHPMSPVNALYQGIGHLQDVILELAAKRPTREVTGG